MKTAVILGTSRHNGNTHKLANLYVKHSSADLFYLDEYKVYPFDYLYRNTNDDFVSLMRIIIGYDHIVFATPVYWYAMSGQMKIFFDRFCGLYQVH